MLPRHPRVVEPHPLTSNMPPPPLFQVEFRSFLRDVFHIDECVSAADTAFAASLPALDPAQVSGAPSPFALRLPMTFAIWILPLILSLIVAQNSPLCEEGGCGHLLQSDVTTPTVMVPCP